MIDNRIGDDWYLLPIARPDEHIPQRRVNPHPPSQDTRGSLIEAEKLEFESDTPWEKGMFIDIYA